MVEHIRKYNLYICALLFVETFIIIAVFYKPYKKKIAPLTIEQQLALNNQKNIAVNYSEANSNPKPISLIEKNIVESGLVNIIELDASIVVKLKYSSTDNFTGTDLYGNLEKAYLQKTVAEKLVLANIYLKERFPFYSILVFDAVRPLSVQEKMWQLAKLPEGAKSLYLSRPSEHSIHNYGAAVDVSLINEEGWEIDMGTPYDYFGELGFPANENKMIEQGKLTYRQIENRKLLREVMYKAGFTGIETEWWHFNACGRNEAKEKYPLIN